MKQIAVLFARKDSIYKTMPGCDVYDIARDARTWPGGSPIVAHPPCRTWGEMSHMAKAPDGESELSIWAVEQIRKYGGVLEHPKRSKLWPTLKLPTGQQRDKWGGFSVLVDQFWWGHKAKKATLLYVCGITPQQLPIIPLNFNQIQYTVSTAGRQRDGTRRIRKTEMPKSERDVTPPDFAQWLVELARKVE